MYTEGFMSPYTIRKSARAKRLRITIVSGGEVVVTVPLRMSILKAELFVEEKREWIEKQVKRMGARKAKLSAQTIPEGTKRGLLEHKKEALALINVRLTHFNTIYGLAWKNIAVKNLKTRWGSCSKAGNLNFSYKIIYLRPELADYLIVHELCHLGEFNHSPNFWKLVEKAVPDYLALRKELRGII
jgi:predicted metal-dependent hydrolase